MYVCTPYVHLLYIYSSIPYDTIIFSNNLVLFVCLPYHEQPANKQTKPQNSTPQTVCDVNISSNIASKKRLIIVISMWNLVLLVARDCKLVSLSCHTFCVRLLAKFLVWNLETFVPRVVGYHTYIKYDVYELPGEDRQFYVIHFYKKRRVDGYRDDYSLGQLTTDLSGTIAVSLRFWINM